MHGKILRRLENFIRQLEKSDVKKKIPMLIICWLVAATAASRAGDLEVTIVPQPQKIEKQRGRFQLHNGALSIVLVVDDTSHTTVFVDQLERAIEQATGVSRCDLAPSMYPRHDKAKAS